MERCELCGSEVGDDDSVGQSYECEICFRIICEWCINNGTPMEMDTGYVPVICRECGAKYDSM